MITFSYYANVGLVTTVLVRTTKHSTRRTNMYRTLVSLLCLIAMSSNANADTMADMAIRAVLEKAPSKHTRSCGNFGGHWKGSCKVGDGQSVAEEMEVTQINCDVVQFGRESTVFPGGTSTGASVLPY